MPLDSAGPVPDGATGPKADSDSPLGLFGGAGAARMGEAGACVERFGGVSEGTRAARFRGRFFVLGDLAADREPAQRLAVLGWAGVVRRPLPLRGDAVRGHEPRFLGAAAAVSVGHSPTVAKVNVASTAARRTKGSSRPHEHSTCSWIAARRCLSVLSVESGAFIATKVDCAARLRELSA